MGTFLRGASRVPQHACPTCARPFWTRVGLEEHEAQGAHDGRLTVRRRRKPQVHVMSEVGLRVLRESGRRLAAQNNARRVRCRTCGLVSTPAAVGIHQKAKGHSGRKEVQP